MFQKGWVFYPIRPDPTRTDPINFGFGSGLKPDRIETYKPDQVVIGSGQTRPDPNTRSGSQKKN